MDDWWKKTFPEGRQTVVIEDASGDQVAIAYGKKGAGQPLILLHGIASWSYNWRYCIEPLSQQFQVFCIDAKGHGFSQTSAKPDIVGHQVVELERILRALFDRPVAIAAESLGALTALALVENQPDLVERLILINVPIFPKQLPSIGMRILADMPLDLVRLVDQLQLARPFNPLLREIVRFLRQEVVLDPDALTSEELDGLIYPYVNFPGVLTQFAMEVQQATQEIQNMLNRRPNLITTAQQNLHKVTCPSLVLWGDQDRWFPVEDGQKLHELLPNSRFQRLPNCGHNAPGCNPTALNAAILEFLSAPFVA